MRARLTAGLISCLLVFGCGGNGGTTPTGPTNTPTTGSSLIIAFSGSLGSLDGAPLEATILFDGREVPGARTTCAFASGCSGLVLVPQSTLGVTSGQHTVSFQVVRQGAQGRAAYFAFGGIVVSRGGPPIQSITLVERNASIGAGESISYQITING